MIRVKIVSERPCIRGTAADHKPAHDEVVRAILKNRAVRGVDQTMNSVCTVRQRCDAISGESQQVVCLVELRSVGDPVYIGIGLGTFQATFFEAR